MATRGRRAEQVLHPVVASLAGYLVDTSGQSPFQWTGPQTEVTLSNLGSAAVDVTLTLDLSGNGPRERTVTITAPGGQSQSVTVSPTQRRPVVLRLAVPPGSSQVRLEATGDGEAIPGSQGRDYAALKVSDLRLTTESGTNVATLQQFVAASPQSLR